MKLQNDLGSQPQYKITSIRRLKPQILNPESFSVVFSFHSWIKFNNNEMY